MYLVHLIIDVNFGNTPWLLIIENEAILKHTTVYMAVFLYYIRYEKIPQFHGYCPILMPLLVRDKVTTLQSVSQ